MLGWRNGGFKYVGVQDRALKAQSYALLSNLTLLGGWKVFAKFLLIMTPKVRVEYTMTNRRQKSRQLIHS